MPGDSKFVGEEIYNVVPFLFINYRIYMALDETMKTFTFDVANIEITCDQAPQRKWANLRTA